MKDTKYSRKDFLKKAALATGTAVIGTQMAAANAINISSGNTTLNADEMLFLKEYSAWLKAFNRFVHLRNQNPMDVENNKQLMALSAEAEVRKPLLEKYMQNPIFAQQFNHITEDITQNITS
jgi:hypothetical protein